MGEQGNGKTAPGCSKAPEKELGTRPEIKSSRPLALVVIETKTGFRTQFFIETYESKIRFLRGPSIQNKNRPLGGFCFKARKALFDVR